MAIAKKIRVLDKKSFPGWLKSAGKPVAIWAREHGFKAAPGERLVIPDLETGGIAGAVMGAAKDDFTTGAHAALLPAGDWQVDGGASEAFGLGFLMQQYRFDRFRMKKNETPQPRLILGDKKLGHRLDAVNGGISLTRDLINLPANHLDPDGLETEARKLAKKFGAKIKVTKGRKLATDFPAIDVVGRAAASPPRLIEMNWGSSGKRITLIGKGVTFDSGGLDLKPSGGMELMKKDMGGAGIVLGLAHAIMALKLRLRLRVLVPVAENAVSAESFRPLDVIKTAAGIPVEVGNTDAEGRLILADALHLATSGAKANLPDLMVDFATLTGAARVALGTELPALFCNDDTLCHEFLAAGEKAGDPLWAMPLHAPYDRHLDGGHTALSSTGATGYGGAITAALFLKRFLKQPVPWAHIDVMAWNQAARPGHPRGGEAMGLRAALALIEKTISKN